MLRRSTLALLLAMTSLVWAQYPVSLQPAVIPTDTATVDTSKVDTVKKAAQDKPSVSPERKSSEFKEQALTWVRRLIYRGYLDDQTSGTSATYALTGWNETSGPYGSVIAHVTVVYLGSVSWVGKPAEWFQATYKSLDKERPSVDFDLVLAAGDKLGEAYRALWRLNKEELSAFSFALPGNEFDYDREDQPRAGEQTNLKLYSGDFPVTKYLGSGANGAKVIAYRGTDVPPLGLVRLGYGNNSLNLRDRASDVLPKLQVPLPTSR